MKTSNTIKFILIMTIIADQTIVLLPWLFALPGNYSSLGWVGIFVVLIQIILFTKWINHNFNTRG